MVVDLDTDATRPAMEGSWRPQELASGTEAQLVVGIVLVYDLFAFAIKL